MDLSPNYPMVTVQKENEKNNISSPSKTKSNFMDSNITGNDDCSTHSNAFYLCQTSCSLLNSKNETCAPISVRDMVKRYDSAAKSTHKHPKLAPQFRHSNHALPTTKSSYFGLNKYGSQTNFNNTMEQDEMKSCSFCRSWKGDYCCQNRSRRVASCCVSTTSPENDQSVNGKDLNKVPSNLSHNAIPLSTPKNSCCFLQPPQMSVDTNTLFVTDNPKRLTRSPSRGPKEHRNSTSVHTMSSLERKNSSNTNLESSYQSKTTIAKTSSGVRIIIDIFFDQDNNSNNDVVGSRVETDIPQSRILNEFQEQLTSSKHSKLNRPE